MAAAQDFPADSGAGAAPLPTAHPWIARLSAYDGRAAALALLIAMGLGFARYGETLWNPWRDLLFDGYQRLNPRAVLALPAVIVAIDEQSLAAFGRWPWPRTRLAQLIEATHRLGALAVGLDMVLADADNQSPQQLLAERSNMHPTLRAALAALPSNDAILTAVMSRVPTVVGRAARADGKTGVSPGIIQTPVVTVGASPGKFMPNFTGQLANLPEIDQAAAGRGYLNDGRNSDGFVRSIPLILAINGTLAPAFALELLRVATHESLFRVHSDDGGVRAIQIGSSLIPTDADGSLRIYFAPAVAARHVSAADILGGKLKSGAFANQVALIGATAVGFADVVATPAATQMTGVEVQAQLIENIQLGTRLIRPPTAHWWEALAFTALGLILIVLWPRSRLIYFLGFYLLIGLALVATSYAFFQQRRWLYDPSFAIAGNLPVVVVLLTAGLAASRRQRRALDAKLALERAERLRVQGEMRAAREIQMGMLPDPRNIAGIPRTLDFFALLEPAQDIGGDLYDAFMLDPRRLCFMIGDVCGKGVPASLFMALAKTLSKSLARRQSDPLESIMRAVNQEISGENPAAMYVTAILAVVDGESGEAIWCNAGHPAPILLRPKQAPRLLDGADGPPLCVDETFAYSSQRLRLEPGDILLLITDGVNEAENGQLSQYGMNRVIECFAQRPPSDAAQACEQLRADVKNFIAGAVASDDLTIVALCFVGKGES